MTISVAFFISPTGDVIHVSDCHIATVIRDPETFSLTREEIEAFYKEYGERVGVEGKARREILLRIIADGWIRIRRYRQHWSVTAETLTPVVQDRLREWAGKMLAGINGFKEPDRYMPVRVSTSEGDFNYTIGDLAEGTCPR